ncbi:hypothetical protein HY480_01485 [Candidatus Uhrbacteria bacterium]|nr:hypothetical protein [Candidatus Uhrbacteria bacterium]
MTMQQRESKLRQLYTIAATAIVQIGRERAVILGWLRGELDRVTREALAEEEELLRIEQEGFRVSLAEITLALLGYRVSYATPGVGPRRAA